MWKRRRTGGDFSREIQGHLEIEADRLVGEGLSRDDARLAARKAFGSVMAAEERFYESRRVLWLDHLRQDVRGAARAVARYPFAAIVAVVSLAFGIGALTTTLTVRNVVFRKPPPAYGHPSQLSRVQFGRPDRPITPLGSYVPGPLVEILRTSLGDRLAAATPPRGSRDVRAEDRNETIAIRTVTPGFFSVLEVSPALGTLSFDGGSPTAVLSFRVWRFVFDGRPDVVGRPLWIDGRPYSVAGVLPERFWFTQMNSAIWTAIDPKTLAAEDGLDVVVRRPDGVSEDALTAQLLPALATYVSTRPGERQAQVHVSTINGTPLGHNADLVPYVLAGSVVLTLVIACANVAILMIAQWTAREHEIAIRASLGASRGRIVRALVTESVLLAAAGGAFGICATFALRGIIISRSGAGNVLSLYNLSIDPAVLVESILITAAAGIAAGLAPALYETRRLHANPLSALAAYDGTRQRFRHALVVLEITVTIALLVETGAMIGGYQRTIAADMGFDRRPLFAARVENSGGLRAAQTLELVARQPGVLSAAVATGVPYMGSGRKERVSSFAGGASEVPADRIAVSPGFFATLGVPLESGRDFTARDSVASRVAIVNGALSRQLFAGRPALGNRLFVRDTAYDIVGVAGDYATHQFEPKRSAAKMFVPFALDDAQTKGLQILVRAAGDPAPVLQAIRRELRNAAAGNTIPSSFTYDEVVRVGAEEILAGTAPLVPLIAIGMLLTTAGIYGVLAFAIVRRSRELAVRVAIGATGRDLVTLVTAHSVRLVLVGTAAGIGLTFALSRVVRASGGAGSIYDPDWPAFVVPVLIVAVIAVLATLIPSRRATKIDPAVLLRTT